MTQIFSQKVHTVSLGTSEIVHGTANNIIDWRQRLTMPPGNNGETPTIRPSAWAKGNPNFTYRWIIPAAAKVFYGDYYDDGDDFVMKHSKILL